MTVTTCNDYVPPSPAAARRLLVVALLMAGAILAESWLAVDGVVPTAGIVVNLTCLLISAALLSPVAPVRWLPWATAALLASSIIALTLMGAPVQPTGIAFLGMMLSLLTPVAWAGLLATAILVGAEFLAALS